MSAEAPLEPQWNAAHDRIRTILTQARSRSWQAVNAEMVAAYWEIGRVIAEEELRGAARADYGKQVIAALSGRLSQEFGKGFDRSNLSNMRNLYRVFPIRDALRHELAWTHYRLLLRVENPDARAFYEAEAVAARWSTRELERQINSLLFERLALSRDRAGVLALAQEGHALHQPADLVKDPYVLEFTGLRQDERLLEADLERALLGRLQQFLLELGNLYRALVDQRQAVDASAYTHARRGPGLFIVPADLPPDSGFPAAEGRVEAAVARIRSAGVTPAELQKARNWGRTDICDGLEATAGRARWLAREAVDDGDAGRVNTFLPRLDGVTQDDVRRAARRYLVASNRIVLDVTPVN